MHQLELELRQIQDVCIVRLRGAIEAGSFGSLAGVLNRLIEGGSQRIVLECRQVSYIGSAELRELLDLAHYARSRDGDIKCVGLAPTMQYVANLIANGDPLDCHDAVSNALASFHTAYAPALH